MVQNEREQTLGPGSAQTFHGETPPICGMPLSAFLSGASGQESGFLRVKEGL